MALVDTSRTHRFRKITGDRLQVLTVDGKEVLEEIDFAEPPLVAGHIDLPFARLLFWTLLMLAAIIAGAVFGGHS